MQRDISVFSVDLVSWNRLDVFQFGREYWVLDVLGVLVGVISLPVDVDEAEDVEDVEDAEEDAGADVDVIRVEKEVADRWKRLPSVQISQL